MRSVFILAVLVFLGAIPIACGDSASVPASTSNAACMATTAASPTTLATATQPSQPEDSGQLAFAGMIEGAPAAR